MQSMSQAKSRFSSPLSREEFELLGYRMGMRMGRLFGRRREGGEVQGRLAVDQLATWLRDAGFMDNECTRGKRGIDAPLINASETGGENEAIPRGPKRGQSISEPLLTGCRVETFARQRASVGTSQRCGSETRDTAVAGWHGGTVAACAAAASSHL